MGKKIEGDVVLEHVRDLTSDYLEQRGGKRSRSPGHVAVKRKDTDRTEARECREYSPGSLKINE